MSRAFVRESDSDAVDTLPDRPISPHPNFVTQAGVAKIDSRLRELEGGGSAPLAARAAAPRAGQARGRRGPASTPPCAGGSRGGAARVSSPPPPHPRSCALASR